MLIFVSSAWDGTKQWLMSLSVSDMTRRRVSSSICWLSKIMSINLRRSLTCLFPGWFPVTLVLFVVLHLKLGRLKSPRKISFDTGFSKLSKQLSFLFICYANCWTIASDSLHFSILKMFMFFTLITNTFTTSFVEFRSSVHNSSYLI